MKPDFFALLRSEAELGDLLDDGKPNSIASLRQEVEDAGWADYGRAVHSHLMAPGAIEQVITRLALQPGITTKDIAGAIRVYLTTGVRT